MKEIRTCEFCGEPIEVRKNGSEYCSKICCQRAAHDRLKLRLDMTLSKRFRRRLMFSDHALLQLKLI